MHEGWLYTSSRPPSRSACNGVLRRGVHPQYTVFLCLSDDGDAKLGGGGTTESFVVGNCRMTIELRACSGSIAALPPSLCLRRPSLFCTTMTDEQQRCGAREKKNSDCDPQASLGDNSIVKCIRDPPVLFGEGPRIFACRTLVAQSSMGARRNLLEGETRERESETPPRTTHVGATEQRMGTGGNPRIRRETGRASRDLTWSGPGPTRTSGSAHRHCVNDCPLLDQTTAFQLVSCGKERGREEGWGTRQLRSGSETAISMAGGHDKGWTGFRGTTPAVGCWRAPIGRTGIEDHSGHMGETRGWRIRGALTCNGVNTILRAGGVSDRRPWRDRASTAGVTGSMTTTPALPSPVPDAASPRELPVSKSAVAR